jgi:hypothetical protein
MNKRISLGLAIAVAAIMAAVAVIITYNYSLDKFNEMLSSFADNEQTFSRISELDSYVRGS